MDRVESLARCIHPGILAYFRSEEGQKEFAEWKKTEAEREGPEPQYIEGEPTLVSALLLSCRRRKSAFCFCYEEFL